MEKHFTLSVVQAAGIVDLVEAKGFVALEAMWTRFIPYMLWLHGIFSAGTLGEIRPVTGGHRQKLPLDPAQSA